MANPEHLKILKPGVKVWDAWRQDHPEEQPDLIGQILRNANFLGGTFSWRTSAEGSSARHTYGRRWRV